MGRYLCALGDMAVTPTDIAVITAVLQTRIAECARTVAMVDPERPAAVRCKKHGERCAAALAAFERVIQGDLPPRG